MLELIHHRKHQKTGHNILFLYTKTPCRWQELFLTQWMIRQTGFILWVCLYRVQVAVCALCLWDCSIMIQPDSGQLWVSPDEFTRRTEELWIFGVNRSPGVAALDILFGFQCCLVVSVTFHPLQSSKDWNIHVFWHFGAYLRRSTGLYLAASWCIVLIFLWTLRPICKNTSLLSDCLISPHTLQGE